MLVINTSLIWLTWCCRYQANQGYKNNKTINGNFTRYFQQLEKMSEPVFKNELQQCQSLQRGLIRKFVGGFFIGVFTLKRFLVYYFTSFLLRALLESRGKCIINSWSTTWQIRSDCVNEKAKLPFKHIWAVQTTYILVITNGKTGFSIRLLYSANNAPYMSILFSWYWFLFLKLVCEFCLAISL